MKRVKDKFYPAFSGVVDLIKTESSVRIQLILGIGAVGVGYLLKFSYGEMLVVGILAFVVISMECCNTVIEWLVDAMYPEYNENAKRIKDGAAAMVLVASIGSMIIGGYILIRNLFGG